MEVHRRNSDLQLNHDIRDCANNYRHPSLQQQEQGMAMVMALLMGAVLLAGTTGLMIRQMMARKLRRSRKL